MEHYKRRGAFVCHNWSSKHATGPIIMKQRLAKLKRLQTALASLQAPTDIKARLTAAKELTNVLTYCGTLVR